MAEQTPAAPRRPVLVLVGADKGGVGKTVLTRALVDLLVDRGAPFALFDTEGHLRRFLPVAELVDLEETRGQMRVFDAATRSRVTVVDLRAALLSATIRAMGYAGYLADDGELDVVVLHVLNPDFASIGEIASVSGLLSGGARHYLVKNRASERDFQDWDDEKQRRAFAHVEPAGVLEMPHMDEIAAAAVDERGCAFRAFEGDARNSGWLRGKVRHWLSDAHAEIARAVRELAP